MKNGPAKKRWRRAFSTPTKRIRSHLIEAGTGTGKSLAYLVPAIFWALKHQEKTVITTHTIALQEQLLHKDIPFLLKTMDVELKACLVKGMSNYLCLRKASGIARPAFTFLPRRD